MFNYVSTNYLVKYSMTVIFSQVRCTSTRVSQFLR